MNVTVFSETYRVYSIPNHKEMLRSENDAYIWVFFVEEVSARVTRNLGMLLLKETKQRNNTIKLNSFDRLFSNQDFFI